MIVVAPFVGAGKSNIPENPGRKLRKNLALGAGDFSFIHVIMI